MRPYHRKLSIEPTRVLVRHADAGRREAWAGDDGLRELTRIGHKQADDLAVRIGGMPILRVLSSPALRCQQTVTPLANELSIRVELCSLLGPDADPDRLLRFLQAAETENAVVCTHRETLIGLFDRLMPGGPAEVAGAAPMAMAAAWILQGGAGGPHRLRHLHRPSPSSTEDDARLGGATKTEQTSAPTPG